MTLRDRVTIGRRFQRSIRVDSDIGEPQALEGFICPRSSADVVRAMVRHLKETRHAAFTWTGPYGSGKSSLAVALCAALSSAPKLLSQAEKIFGRALVQELAATMPAKSKGWRILPAVGRRAPLAQVLGDALAEGAIAPKGVSAPWTDEKILKTVMEISQGQANAHGGLLILIDEMGKVLEGAVHDGHDIYLLQQLAEAASRSGGRLILIGVLHQAFDEYAQRLAREVRDEWAKVQGRFVDLVVNLGGDEQLELLSRAIEANGKKAISPVVKAITENVLSGRPGASPHLAKILSECWPLHPVVACLLGPLSRRRFGQNQRSLFAFLNSAEPFGLHDFLADASTDDLYMPDRLWDYLKTNLEPAVLASPDGHRWSTGVDAIERCEAIGGSPLHLALIKTIVLLDLFRERSGLSATPELLSHCVGSAQRNRVAKALKQLESWSFTIFRKHLGAYGIFAGSDFDIEDAIAKALPSPAAVDLDKLRTIAGLQPILAKRHYHDTGALRWFNLDLVRISDLGTAVGKPAPLHGAAGRFLLAFPTQGETRLKARKLCAELTAEAPGNVVVGLSDQAWHVCELARELFALTTIHDERPELRGDSVARREVIARLGDVRARLEQDLQRMCDGADWYRSRNKPARHSTAELNTLASRIADERFPKAPRILNELVNREQPSSNAVKAMKDLLRRMIEAEGQSRLGIEGFPAEAGLFQSILIPSQAYRRERGEWRFLPPDGKHDPCRLKPMWDAALDLLSKAVPKAASLDTIYTLWREQPFGIKDGLMPILAVSLILAHQDKIAIYRQGVFQSRVTDVDVDVLVSDPTLVQLRWLELTGSTERILRGLATVTTPAETRTRAGIAKPIDVARSLIAMYDRLPAWTKRTARVSASAQRVATLFRYASDPNRFLFDDIPALLGESATGKEKDDISHVVETVRSALEELREAYPFMLDNLERMMLAELQVPNSSKQAVARLRDRAVHMIQVTGDFRLNAFIARLSEYKGESSDIEAIASLAINKRPMDWVDADLDQARIELAELSQKFIRTEAFTRVKDRPEKRHRMAVVVPLEGRPTALESEFDVMDYDRADVDSIVRKVEVALKGADQRRKNLILAALAELSARYIQASPEVAPNRRKGSR